MKKNSSNPAKKIIRVHFVCTGNAYRSRLAEAYLKSKQLPHIHASSSGIEADKNSNGPMTWYAARLALRYDLTPYMSPHWIQTQPHTLRQAHIIVFMHKKHHDIARKRFQISDIRSEVWDISDLHEQGFSNTQMGQEEESRAIAATERTFEDIKRNVDDLIIKLTKKK